MLLWNIDAGEDIFLFSSHYDLTSFVFGLNQCDMSVPPACKMGFSRMSPTTGILCVSNKVMRHHLKSGYMGFAWLESSADATPAVMFSPAVAMAVEVQCQRPPARAQCLHISTMSNHPPTRCVMQIIRCPMAVANSEPKLPWQPPGSTLTAGVERQRILTGRTPYIARL